MSAIPILITMLGLGQAPSESPKLDTPASEASLKVLQQRAGTTRVALSKEAGREAKLVDKPVFRYSDELRHIEDAGFWLWTHRYDDGLADLVDGAVFGFTGTGTNPDVLLLLEHNKDGGWQFGIAGMTAWGANVRLKDTVVWQIPDAAGKSNVFDNWMFFVPTK